MGRHLSVDHCYVVFAQFKLSLEHMQHKLSFKLYDEYTRSETNKQLRHNLTTHNLTTHKQTAETQHHNKHAEEKLKDNSSFMSLIFLIHLVLGKLYKTVRPKK